MNLHSKVRYGINPQLFANFSSEDWHHWNNEHNPCTSFALFQTRVSRVGAVFIINKILPLPSLVWHGVAPMAFPGLFNPLASATKPMLINMRAVGRQLSTSWGPANLFL
jgi:hypothetical protein